MKTQAAERENWNCENCRTEKVRMLQEEMLNAPRQIDVLKARNREPEEKLLLARAGKRHTVHAKHGLVKCMVGDDSMLHNFGA